MRSATRRTSRITGVAIRRKEIDVGKQNVAGEIGALQQQARRDPTCATGPTGHGGRREELLAQRARRHVEIGNTGNILEAEFAIGGDGQFAPGS